MILAKDGYAVGGVYFDGDQHVTAMSIVFMRITANGLNTADTYRSRWIGQPTGRPTELLGGDGKRVVGIYGRKGLNVDALGLILLDATEE